MNKMNSQPFSINKNYNKRENSNDHISTPPSPLNGEQYNSHLSQISQTSDLVEDTQLLVTSKILNNNEVVLNCLQFINFIQYYFNDTGQSFQINEPSSFMQLSINNFDHTGEKETAPFKPDDLTRDKKKSNGAVITTCFPCIVCSSQFSFEQTFHLHLERRSILIRFYCLKCETFKTFYNPCKLLYHIYSHKLYLFDPIYKSIKIQSITLERLNLSKEKNIDMFRNYTNRLSNGSSNLNGLRPSRILVNENYQIKQFLKQLIANKFLLFKCAICGALFFELKELRQHYFRSQQAELDKINQENSHKSAALNRRIIYKYLKQKYSSAFSQKGFKWLDSQDADSKLFVDLLNSFSFKKLQFSTRCSTIASMNLIHTNFQFFQPNRDIIKTPILVCPECGLSFSSETQSDITKFRLHLIYGCLFTMKYDCGQIKCPNCPVISDSVNHFVNHWSRAHVKNQHQCDLCDKQGKEFIIKDETSNQPLSPTELCTEHTYKQSNKVFKLNLNGDDSTNCDMKNSNDSNLSDVSDINKHYFEKHKNQEISLKLAFNCMCKNDDSSLNDTNEISHSNIIEKKCLHSTWKSCHNHIISLMHRTIASLTCFFCQKLIPNEKYSSHLKTSHNIDKINICPICGVLKEDTTLQLHIIQNHSKLDLKKHLTNSFFNLATTLNPIKESQSKASEQSLPILQEDFDVYQCLNCHHFFSANCSFSHNCWTYTNSSTNSDLKQPSTNNNYFSPIYLKFNVSKILNSRNKNNPNITTNDEPSQMKKMKIAEFDLNT